MYLVNIIDAYIKNLLNDNKYPIFIKILLRFRQ